MVQRDDLKRSAKPSALCVPMVTQLAFNGIPPRAESFFCRYKKRRQGRRLGSLATEGLSVGVYLSTHTAFLRQILLSTSI